MEFDVTFEFEEIIDGSGRNVRGSAKYTVTGKTLTYGKKNAIRLFKREMPQKHRAGFERNWSDPIGTFNHKTKIGSFMCHRRTNLSMMNKRVVVKLKFKVYSYEEYKQIRGW